MKTLNTLIMGLLLSGCVFTTCEPEQEPYASPSSIQVQTEAHSDGIWSFSFSVGARQWRKASGIDRYIEVSIPAITDSILKSGAVILFLNEGGRHVSLPFTYYQVRRALSFQPSYEKGKVFVNVLGNFILNNHTEYHFRVMVVNSKVLKRFEDVNWYSYQEALAALKARKAN